MKCCVLGAYTTEIFSQFWRLKVQDPGVSRVDSSEDSEGRICSRSLRGLSMTIFSLYLHIIFLFICVHISSPFKDTCH